MHNCYLVRYGEISLKGKNRLFFEKKLVSNIKDCLLRNKIKKFNIKLLRGRIIIFSEENCDCMKYVFGIVSFSPAMSVELGEINEKASELYKKGTFRVTTHRLDKRTDKDSYDYNREVGKYIVDKKNGKVDLNNYDTEIGLELIDGKGYLFTEKINGLGGLPVGVSGKVCLVLENKESIKAGILMMKRGCELLLYGKIDIKELEKYSSGFKLKFIDKLDENIPIVVNDRLETIREHNFNGLILRPLI